LKFRRGIQSEQGMRAIGIVPLVNVLFLLVIFLALSSVLTFPASIGVKFPKALTSDVIQEDNIVIAITGENVIYVNNKIVATKDLKVQMGRLTNKHAILIKADRRASVGRVIDVWNSCRALGIERVNIATTQEQ
jgi:biopolymer transport protein ExbD